MTIRNENPMGHLRTVNFQRAPNVSITRVHGLQSTASLSDAPSGFTGGCHPTSTSYCRQQVGRPVHVELAAPAPVFQAPAAPVTVRTGGGYDASKFTPRTYGDASLVPGIAYVPTSKVVRDPAAAQQVLDSGQTRPQDIVVPGTGTAPHLGMVGHRAPVQQNFGGSQFSGVTQTQGLVLAPTRVGPSFGQPSTPVLQRTGPLAGSFASPIANDGTYWEKVSGPTRFGNTTATTVICKRQAQQRVVRPVVGVPVPVPVAVQQGCQQVRLPAGRYGQNAPGRWIQ
jgi:hypothetical protein